jgi:nicotinamidase/pyrazinamidase
VNIKFGGNAGLLLVDIQRDFCSGGALAVPDGDAVVAVANRWIERARSERVPIIASRDWHPSGHVSFAERGGQWPPHCVRGTPGAAFHPNLRLPPDAIIVSKGTELDRDAYSAFDAEGLAERLRTEGVAQLWVCGLALDYCVRATVLDALEMGFRVHLVRAGTRAVNVHPGDGQAALAEIIKAGAVVDEST